MGPGELPAFRMAGRRAVSIGAATSRPVGFWTIAQPIALEPGTSPAGLLLR